MQTLKKRIKTNENSSVRLFNRTPCFNRDPEKEKEKHKNKPSRRNPFATYGTTWKKMRLRFLAENPLCVFCLKQGKSKPANVVDHIVPHKGDASLFWDTSNWQALCWHCHSSIKQKIEKVNRRNGFY